MGSTRLLAKAGQVLLICALVLTACGPAVPTPTPTLPSTATATSAPSGGGLQKLELGPIPPALVTSTPSSGGEWVPGQPLVLTFDQPMDAASLQEAFSIDPPLAGRIEIEGRTLVFTPDEAPERGGTYHVRVGETAKSAAGLPLNRPVELRLQTAGYLEVATVQPSDGAEDVAPQSMILVTFNRPVVPMVSIEDQADLPHPLEFSPSLEGEGAWINTSVYAFRPMPSLGASTDYQVTVKAGLTDVTGISLPEDFVWSFSTAPAEILSVEPIGEAIAPDTAITMTFSVSMDRPSTEKAFTMVEVDTGQAVAGTFAWSQDDTVLTFQPEEMLTFGAEYALEVTEAARPAGGQGNLARGESWRVWVVPTPAVLKTSPSQGAQDADVLGGVEIYFSAPVLESTIGPNLQVLPEPAEVYTYYAEYESRLWISFEMEPQTEYRVVLGKDISDRWGNHLPEDFELRFRTGDYPPMIDLAGAPGYAAGVYGIALPTTALIRARNIPSFSWELYRMPLEEFVKFQGPDSWKYREGYVPSEKNLLREQEVETDFARNVIGQLTLNLAGDPAGTLEPGTYFLRVIAPNPRDKEADPLVIRQVLLVSPYHMLLKAGPRQSLVWITEPATGEPVSDVAVQLMDDVGKVLATGTTDEEGVFLAQHEALEDAWRPMLALAGEPETPQFGFISSDWSQGISPWDFDLNWEDYRNLYAAYLYTDRPIYQPGQTVYFKGAVRLDDDAHYSLPPAGGPVRVSINDPEGNRIYQETLTLSPNGTFYGDMVLAEEAPTGYYYMEVYSGDEQLEQPFLCSQSFQVAEYRKPEYEVIVSPDKNEYVQGEIVSLAVQANYYFGGPVKNAKVQWSVLSQDFWFDYQGEGWYSFSDATWEYRPEEGPYGVVIANGEGTTDAEGRFVFRVPAALEPDQTSQRFTIDVSITDVNDQIVSSSASVVVHKGEYYIGLRGRSYVLSTDEPAEVEVITVDPQSLPVPSVPLTMVVATATWDTVREEDEEGNVFWTSKIHETPVLTRTLTTDAQGEGIFSFTPESGGLYRVRAIGEDSRGNEVRSALFLWVSGRRGEYVGWRVENNDRIELVADKTEYEPGEKATILIPSPFEGPYIALVTLERGSLYEHQLYRFETNSPTIEIPIVEEYIPNVYVSVALFRAGTSEEPWGNFKLGYVKLPVNDAAKTLTVEISPDKAEYAPRDQARFAIRATDWMGRPVQAEFSVGLIDKALLALGGAQQGNMKDAFWHERGVGFRTAGTIVVSIERSMAALTKPSEGGKGGGGGGAAEELLVRTEFPDIAYWNPAITTNADGKADITVRLPDNLTTWRMDARGITRDTRVGLAVKDVVSTLPLLVRPVLPRFFVIGDEVEISAVVHNNSEEDLDVALSLDMGGLETDDAQDVTLTVPAGGSEKASWRVRVQPSETARVQFTAEGGALRDAVELTLPVYHASSPETVATAGVLDASGEVVEAIVPPSELDPSLGGLRVAVQPSLAAAMQDGLTYLENYPYECTEAVVSRFLPNVMTYRAMTSLGISDKGLETKLAQLVGVALQKLYNTQHFSSGWGWWPENEADDYITAYVLFGMSQAQEAGFLVDEKVMTRAADYLAGTLIKPAITSQTWELNREAFKVYALAEYYRAIGEDPSQMVSRAVLLFDSRAKLGMWGKALLANAFELMDAGQESRVSTLLSDIYSGAVLSATGAHWEEAERSHRNLNTDTHTTSIVLSALARNDPSNPLAANAVRWLMSVRKEGRWESTFETAWALIGLTDWMVATDELEGSYSFTVDVNRDVLLEETVGAQNVDEQFEARVAIADLLLGETNRLGILRAPTAQGEDAGRLYYSADLTYYLPAGEMKELSRGIIVSRQYRLADDPEKAITQAKVGDIIQVRLTIIAPNDLHYVMLEDPLPAGCEAVDTSLATTSKTLEPPKIERTDETSKPWWRWWWYDWWSPTHTELRDEKVVLFATYMPRGTYQYTYLMRASLPGAFNVIPATASETYFPEVFGRSAGETFTVTR